MALSSSDIVSNSQSANVAAQPICSIFWIRLCGDTSCKIAYDFEGSFAVMNPRRNSNMHVVGNSRGNKLLRNLLLFLSFLDSFLLCFSSYYSYLLSFFRVSFFIPICTRFPRLYSSLLPFHFFLLPSLFYCFIITIRRCLLLSLRFISP
jgi:hypothetical protein